METNLQSLKANPIFQLSLASKELFHSNFLYWLSQDENLRPYFEYVISSLCDDKNFWNDLGEYVVLREYKNFDLCICKKIVPIKENENITQEPDENEEEIKEEREAANYDDISHAGEFYLVIENKFKSIANKSQLDKYYNYVKKNNQKRFKDRHKIEHADDYKKIEELEIKITQRKEILKKEGHKQYKGDTEYDELLKQQNELKQKVTCPKNIDIQTKFVLLTLAQTFGERKAIDNNKIWIIRTYEDYAQFLSNSLLDINDEKLTTFNVSFQIIFNYIRFIRTFSLEINKHLGEIGLKKKWNAIFNDKDQVFKSIRCSDIWQKMAMHKIAQELKTNISNMLKDYNIPSKYIDMDSTDKHILELGNPSNRIYIGVQYFHSLALLEIKYRINDNCMFCIQQQGKSLAAGIVIMTGRNEIITSKKTTKEAWKNEVEAFWKICEIEAICKIVDKFDSFGEIHAYESQDKKDGFYYKKIILTPQNSDGPTIEETLNYMVECLKNAINEYSQNPNKYILRNIQSAIKKRNNDTNNDTSTENSNNTVDSKGIDSEALQ